MAYRQRVAQSAVEFKYPGAEHPGVRHPLDRHQRDRGDHGRHQFGKTTLLNLVPRLFDATAGDVLVDGYNVRDIEPELLWSRIGLVPRSHTYWDRGEQPATEPDATTTSCGRRSRSRRPALNSRDTERLDTTDHFEVDSTSPAVDASVRDRPGPGGGPASIYNDWSSASTYANGSPRCSFNKMPQ